MARRPNRGAPAAPQQPAAAPERAYPLGQITIGDAVAEIGEERLLALLLSRMESAADHYATEWAKHQATVKDLRDKGHWRDIPSFRRVEDHQHPMYNGNWANGFERASETVIGPQLERAMKSGDWQEVMMCAGMLCVRDMLYGRAAPAAKPAPAPKAKAVRKTAQKKPAAKKPGPIGQAAQAASRKAVRALTGHAARKAAKPSATDKLKALVEQVRPFFKANPKLSREELIAKVGRGYERITTLDELRTLCAGKSVTPHSVKPKRERRDPPPPAGSGIANLASAQDQAAAAKVLREAQAGIAGQKTLTARFEDGGVNATFTAQNTDAGWTTGWQIGMPLDDGSGGHLVHDAPLRDDGPVEADPNAAIRNCVGDMLEIVKASQKRAEEGPEDDEEARLARTHAAALEKLRAWLLGFQARGVEKIKFLQEQAKGGAQQLELAA